jgi:hypothetical protein
VLHGGGPASDFIFVPYSVIVVGLRFKWCTLYKIIVVDESRSYIVLHIFCILINLRNHEIRKSFVILLVSFNI